MRKVDSFEASRALRAVDRAARGERIGITPRGKLVASIGPAPARSDLRKVFHDFEKIRKRSKKIPGVTVKS